MRDDESEAASIGVSGVPFFVIDRTYAVSGAQPPDVLLEVLDRVWSERQTRPSLLTVGDGATACDARAARGSTAA